jgi:HTH-type transcriptional regulator/antitoxin HigA
MTFSMPVHPGTTIKDLLKDKNLSDQELSFYTGMSEEYVHGVIQKENPVTAEFAAALEKIFLISADFWINLQTNYDKSRQQAAV